MIMKKPRGRPGRKRKRGRKPSTLPRPAKTQGRHRKQGRRKTTAPIPKKKKHRTQQVEMIARKGQPRPIARVPVLVQADIGGMVASSWIQALQWDSTQKEALMLLQNGYFYAVDITFKIFQAWYYAPSKGTFFNERIKGRFKVRRLA